MEPARQEEAKAALRPVLPFLQLLFRLCPKQQRGLPLDLRVGASRHLQHSSAARQVRPARKRGHILAQLELVPGHADVALRMRQLQCL